MTNKIINEELADIKELKSKIAGNALGMIPDEKFNQFRLSRGVYGQRQRGSQMIRIKIPFGKLNCEQLLKIGEVSEKFADGISHITTRQNIQYHYVKLNDTPKVWEELSEVGLTLREACGNTVRNVTSSPTAGIDPEEPFDVSPYAEAVYEYFIRNPICQDLGRKVKIAFSSSKSDSAFTYFNDIGFIPLITDSGNRGFKVVVGGGLGAQSIIASTAFEFLSEEKIIPFIESTLRVFDRYGERNKRHKARLKFLIQKIGLEEFLKLVESEQDANRNEVFKIRVPKENILDRNIKIEEKSLGAEYDLWRKTNVFEQKQKGLFAVNVRVKLGDLQNNVIKEFVKVVQSYAADEIRLSINQGLILRNILPLNLHSIYTSLKYLELAEPGYDSLADITACPGTDTCNLGITNSTSLTLELEKIIKHEFSEFLDEKYLKIKISGCMNSCGQHMAANIGLHGSSIKIGGNILPAMQLVLGGGVDREGKGFIAERIRKIPTKRVPQLLRILLTDFEENGLDGEYYNSYFRRLGAKYFTTMVKPLENLENLSQDDFLDWGEDEEYKQTIGVGECAGVSYDVISIMLKEAEGKLKLAALSLKSDEYADSLYHSYSVFINGAKAVLLKNEIECNTHINILSDFEQMEKEKFDNGENFKEKVLEINSHKPSKEFAEEYHSEARNFLNRIIEDNNA